MMAMDPAALLELAVDATKRADDAAWSNATFFACVNCTSSMLVPAKSSSRNLELNGLNEPYHNCLDSAALDRPSNSCLEIAALTYQPWLP